MHTGTLWKLLLLLLFLSGLAGCQHSDKPEALRLAVNPWPGYGYFAVAQERGMLNGPAAPALQIVETASLSDSVRAFNRGQVDMLGGTLAELAAINQSGKRPASAVLVLNRSVGADMIVSTGEITRLEELAGKRLALEPASANVLVLAAALSESDLTLEQLELVPLPQGEMPLAFSKSRLDAAITYPPISGELQSIPGIHRLFDTSEAPNAVTDVLIVADEILEERPELLERLVHAHNRALLWSRENAAETRKMLARHTGLSVPELAELESSLEMLTLAEQAPLWQPDACLHRFLPVANRIVGQLNNYPQSGKPAEAILDNRFIPGVSVP